MTTLSTIAVLPDFREEGWVSMEYCAERLLAYLPNATRIDPKYRRLATRLSHRKAAVNLDRFLNRFRTYPKFLKPIRNRFSHFHVVDHSYAHLVHSLPNHRTGVCCHDLDAFLCILEPQANPRPRWMKAMSRKLLTGLQKAAVVFHISEQTRDQLLHYQLIDPAKLIYAPLGIAEEFQPEEEQPPPEWVQSLSLSPWLLHVGSCVPRKRIDLLLDSFSIARQAIPGLKLVKIGGDFTPNHREQIARLGLTDAILHRKDLTRGELAKVYRAAPLVAITSDSEGFGLPAIEALACGAALLASDVPALREAGGPAGTFCPPGNVEAWGSAIVQLLQHPELSPPRSLRLQHARQYTWPNHARIIADAYARLP